MTFPIPTVNVSSSSPNTLAIESTLKEPRAAIRRSDGELFNSPSPQGNGVGSARFPAFLQVLISQAGLEPEEIELLAVSSGPGSFTGLRVGFMMVKTWAWAMQRPVVVVDTMSVIAMTARRLHPEIRKDKLRVVIDAQRQQVFYRDFDLSRDFETDLPSIRIADRSVAINEAASTGSWIVGPAVKASGENRLAIAPEPAVVAELGFTKFRQSGSDDPFAIVPEYGRPSAAEERQVG